MVLVGTISDFGVVPGVRECGCYREGFRVAQRISIATLRWRSFGAD